MASENRRQAEEGLVALMRNGKVSYKHVEGLTEEDIPARIAAYRLRDVAQGAARRVAYSREGLAVGVGTCTQPRPQVPTSEGASKRQPASLVRALCLVSC